MDDLKQDRAFYVHGLLSMAGMYGPLSTIAKNINIFLSENNYPPIKKNDLKRISDECDQQVHLLNDLAFNQEITEDIFRETWFVGIRKWKKIRIRLQTNLEFLISYYEINVSNEVVSLNYGILKDMPLEIDASKFLPKWAQSIYGK